MVVGHRGSPLRFRENTPESFAAAVAEGAAWVELDVRRSADDAVVVNHDAVGPGGVALVTSSAAELARRGVPDLAMVLDGLPAGVGVDVELKNLPGEPDYDEHDALAGLVAEVLVPRLDSRPLLATSFNPSTVAALGARLPAVPTGLLHTEYLAVPAALGVALELGARVLCPHVDAPGLDEATVAEVHGAGVALLVWPVDDPARARALAAAGVDALCTNDPAAITAALRVADR